MGGFEVLADIARERREAATQAAAPPPRREGVPVDMWRNTRSAHTRVVADPAGTGDTAATAVDLLELAAVDAAGLTDQAATG